MCCPQCSPCIFARPRGSAYKRLCWSVHTHFPFQQFRLQPPDVGGDWRGGLGEGGVLHAFFHNVSGWGDTTFVQPIFREWSWDLEICQIWGSFSVRFFFFWSNANNINEYVNPKDIVILAIFWNGAFPDRSAECDDQACRILPQSIDWDYVSHYGALQRQNALTTFFDSLVSDINVLYFRSLTYAQRDNAVKTRIAVWRSFFKHFLQT